MDNVKQFPADLDSISESDLSPVDRLTMQSIAMHRENAALREENLRLVILLRKARSASTPILDAVAETRTEPHAASTG